MNFDSFESLYRANRQELEKIANRFFRDSNQAKDLLQEACLKALRSAHRFDDTTSTVDSDFMAWMYRIMRNTAVNWLRKSERKETHSVPNDSYQIEFAEELPKIEDQLYLQDITKYLQKSMQGRTLLLYANGVKYEEIREQLSVPIGTVRSRINHARNRLKKYLENE